MKESGNSLHRLLDCGRLGMQTGQRQSGLIAVTGLAADGMEQQGSGCNRLGPPRGIGQAHEQAPPVVDQGDEQRHHLAAGVIVRRNDPGLSSDVHDSGIAAIREDVGYGQRSDWWWADHDPISG